MQLLKQKPATEQLRNIQNVMSDAGDLRACITASKGAHSSADPACVRNATAGQLPSSHLRMNMSRVQQLTGLYQVHLALRGGH